MGFLSAIFPPSEADKRATEVRTGAVAPSRSERQQCWAARDGYFACLDAHGIVDALKDEKQAARACGAASETFERDCASQWVSFGVLFRFLLHLLFLGVLVSFLTDRRAGYILQKVAGAGPPEEGEVEGARGAGGEQDGCAERFRTP